MKARRLIAMACALAALAGSLRDAHADPRSDFFCRMLSDTDARVRMSAALRLANLRAGDSVDPLVAALGHEANPAARAAILTAITAVGDPRALAAVERVAQDPSPTVRAQAARALSILRAASAPSAPAAAAVAPRFRIGIGAFANGSEHRPEIPDIARQALSAALGTHPEVVIAGGGGQTPGRLRGYFIDGSVHTSTTADGNPSVQVSLVVQTDPGREFRFESLGSATVTSHTEPGESSHNAAEDIAIRRAVSSAAERTLTQLASTR